MEDWSNGIKDEELVLNTDFMEKLHMDDSDSNIHSFYTFPKKRRTNAWVRKDRYRRQQMRRFLSQNSSVDFENCIPLKRTANTFIINEIYAMDKSFYFLNPVNHLYKTKRGNVAQFRGRVECFRVGILYGIRTKNPYLKSKTNRRIRHEKIDMDNSTIYKYSTLKKKYGSFENGII